MKLCKSVQDSSKEVLCFKAWQISSTAVLIENYENQFFRSDFMYIHVYVFRLSFLTTLDIYKDYFKGLLRWCNLMSSDYSLKLWPETICHNSSFSWRSHCVCAPRVSSPKSFLIFIVWMNWKILQPTSFLSWCVSHVLEFVYWMVSHVLGVVHWNERLSLYYKFNYLLG